MKMLVLQDCPLWEQAFLAYLIRPLCDRYILPYLLKKGGSYLFYFLMSNFVLVIVIALTKMATIMYIEKQQENKELQRCQDFTLVL